MWNKDSYLNVKFDTFKGLRLFWNFKDIKGDANYFRHLFVLLTPKTEQLQTFIDIMYKKMKSGDLFCCLYQTSSEKVKALQWIQKSQISQFNSIQNLKHQTSKNLNTQMKIQILQKLESDFISSNDLIIVNMIIGDDSESFYQNFINRMRSKEKKSFNIFNLFTKSQFLINYHNGINRFKQLTDPTPQFYYSLIYSSVVPYAKVTIQWLNGQMALSHNLSWKNIDFSIIQAEFFGPSSKISEDSFNLVYPSNSTKIINLHLKISLQVTLFSGQKLFGNKFANVKYSQESKFPTSSLSNNTKIYEIFRDVKVNENPYHTRSILKIFPNQSQQKFFQEFTKLERNRLQYSLEQC